jgi:N-acyl-D-amino-acid deacylase
MAAREGRSPESVAYDLLLEGDGKGFLYFPFLNYSDGDFDAIHTMLAHPLAVVGLGDGGAHCGVICDASTPTYLLTHWVRDRSRGPRVPIELVVARQTRETARLYGLDDRGQLAPGLLADVNVIDLDALTLAAPEMVYDLPANGRRLVQRVRGYAATVKRGVVTYENGEATGALPGRLVRGPQAGV